MYRFMLAQCQEKNVVGVEKVATILNTKNASECGKNHEADAREKIGTRPPQRSGTRRALPGAMEARGVRRRARAAKRMRQPMMAAERSNRNRESPPWARPRSSCAVRRGSRPGAAAKKRARRQSALDDVQREAGEAGFLVARLHIEAGEVHGSNDLVERDFVLF